jgi:sn-glycerol 3-phosphate transport system substrate-binding protein
VILGRRSLLAATLAAFAPAVGCSSAPKETAFWFSFGGKPREILFELVAAFHREQSEHRIAPVYQGDYFETLAKLRTAFHAGLAPALVHVVGESVPYLADAGVVERLDVHAELAGDLGFVPALTEAGLFPGERPAGVHALPFNRSTPIAYVNTAMFAEARLEPPETWDELREAARRLTKGDGSKKRFGFACAIDWWFWAALVGQAGGAVFDERGAPTLGGDAGVAALDLWRSLIDRDVMRPPPGRDYNAWQVVNADFIEGRAAMIWTSTAYLRYLEDNAKFPFRTARLPRGVRRAVPTGGTFFVMPKGAPDAHRRAAAAFLAFMARPEHANRFAVETGYIPVTRAGLADLEKGGWFAAHPNAKVAVDQLEDAVGWPWTRDLLFVQREIVQPRLEGAILEHQDPRAAMDAATRAALEGP